MPQDGQMDRQMDRQTDVPDSESKTLVIGRGGVQMAGVASPDRSCTPGQSEHCRNSSGPPPPALAPPPHTSGTALTYREAARLAHGRQAASDEKTKV